MLWVQFLSPMPAPSLQPNFLLDPTTIFKLGMKSSGFHQMDLLQVTLILRSSQRGWPTLLCKGLTPWPRKTVSLRRRTRNTRRRKTRYNWVPDSICISGNWGWNVLLKMPHSSLPSFSTDAKHSLKFISGAPQLLPRVMIDHISTTTAPEEEQDQRTPSHKLVHVLVSSSRSKSTTAVRRRSLTASKGFSGVRTWFGRQGEALVQWRRWKQRSDHCWQSEEFTESS